MEWAVQQAEESGLPGAGWAHEENELAPLDLSGGVPEGYHLPLVGLGHPFETYHRQTPLGRPSGNPARWFRGTGTDLQLSTAGNVPEARWPDAAATRTRLVIQDLRNGPIGDRPP